MQLAKCRSGYCLNVRSSDSYRFFNLCFKAVIVLLISRLLIFHTLFELSDMVELAFTAATAVFAVLSVAFVFTKLKQSVKFLSLTTFLLLLISYLMHTSGLEYLCNIVTLCSIFIVFPFMHMSKKGVVFVYLIFVAFSVFLFFTAPSSAEFDLTHKGMNPNNSSLVCLLTEFLSLSLAFKSKKKFSKFLLVLLTVMLFCFQLSFGGRSSLIGTILMVIYFVFYKFVNRIPKGFYKFIFFFLLVFSILFAYLYSVTLFNSIGKGSVTLMGKDLFTGRQTIWSDIFNYVGNDWLFGKGNTFESSWIITDNAGELAAANNAHNFSLGFAAIFGVIPFLSFTLLIASSSDSCLRFKTKHFAVIMVILFIQCFFETSLYSSYSTYFIFPLLISIGLTDKMVSSKFYRVKEL